MTYIAPELQQVGVATKLVLGGGAGKMDSIDGGKTSPGSESILGLDE